MERVIYTDYATLENNHPNFNEIKIKGIGGGAGQLIKSGVETCCIQMCYAMNRAFLKIGSDYAFPDTRVDTGKVRAVKDQNGDNYIYSTLDMKVYLDNKYFESDNYRGFSRAELTKAIQGKKGILGFGGRHIDLWSGTKFQYEHLYYNMWTIDEHKAGVQTQQNGIYFWEIHHYLDDRF